MWYPRSCGKDGCKLSNRQSMRPQLEGSQGKKYSNTTNPPNSQTAKALRYTVKHLLSRQGGLENRAVVLLFWTRLQLVLPDRLG